MLNQLKLISIHLDGGEKLRNKNYTPPLFRILYPYSS